MRIAVLVSSGEGSSSPFTPLDPPVDPSRYLDGHECVRVAVAKATAVRQVVDVARRGVDVVVNLCDGAWDEDRAGVEVVEALERLGVAFTGAGSDFYDPSREAMKMACRAAGVRFPSYVLARDAGGTASALAALAFPMIVKHPHGYSSVGLTRESVVRDAEALARQAARTIEAYGAALIEEFVEGREFTVLVAEPRGEDELAWALAPIEFRFPPDESFKHFELKWKEFRRMEARPVADAALAARLREAAALVFAALGGSGYGRCDLRVDAAGDIHLLEINPNCAVFYPEGEFGSADIILAHDPAGHRGFIDHLLACALRRRDRARPSAEVRFDPDRGFRLVAARAIAAGEVVERHERRVRVALPWRAGEWRPIDHGCDPELAPIGGHLVARRAVAAGTPLTVDYHELTDMHFEPFDCRCGAAGCRGVVTPP